MSTGYLFDALKVNQQRIILKIIVFLFYILMFSSCSKQLHTNSRVSSAFPFEDIKVVVIHSADGSVGPCEPSIDINPSNPAHIVAGSVLNNVYISSDSGKTWTKDKLRSSFGVYGDPVVRFSDSSTVLFAHLSNPENKAYKSKSFLDRIVVQQSRDGGTTWNNGAWAPADTLLDHDKQWLYVGGQGLVLMGWTAFDVYGSKSSEDQSRILFSSSQNGGLTWAPSTEVSDLKGDCLDDDYTTEGGYPCVGLDGTYYIVWSFNEKIFLDVSYDNGKTWGKDRVIAEQPGGWSFDIPGIGRCNGFPAISCDNSKGPNRGRLYISWSDQRYGTDDTDIWVIYSDNQGQSWSEPIRVNNDRTQRHQFFSAMDVDKESGYIYWVFYDRRNHADLNTDVYLAWSEDGGKTIRNQIISENSFIPKPDIFFGDYNDISASKGFIRPIWTTYEGGKLHVKTALINRK